MALINNQADLAAALLAGGDVACDPTVTINLTAPMNVGAPTRLLGGSFTVPSGPAFVLTSSDVEVEALSITGGNTGTYDPTQTLIYAVGTDTAPLTGIDVHDCTLTGSAAHNIWLQRCTDSTAHDNTVDHFLYSGVMVISGDGVTVANNIVQDAVIAPGQVECYGIAVTDLANTAAARSRNCAVTGNRVDSIDWEGIDTHGGLGITVTGNIVTACHEGIALVSGNTSRVTSPTQCVVTGNRIDGTGARNPADAGVILAGFSGTPASGTITGNNITGYPNPFRVVSWDRANTYVGGNSAPFVPWVNLSLAGGFTANASFPPQYMVDGNTVTVRGGVVPATGGIAAHQSIATLGSAAAWPTVRSFFALTKGSSATTGTGVLNVDVTGALRVDYGSATDSFTYWLNGSYIAG